MDLFSWDGIHIQILLLSSVYGLDIIVCVQEYICKQRCIGGGYQ